MIQYKGLNISDEKFIPELKRFISKFESDEQLLRSGGIRIDLLDRLAHGFSENDLTTITPDKLRIKWKEDLDNVKWEIRQSGLTPKKWAEKINLSEPIDVTFREDKEHKKGFYLEDGHHRYMAAKILGKPLNMNLEVRTSPIMTIAPSMSYDDFHRYVFNKLNPKMTDEINSINTKLRKKLIEYKNTSKKQSRILTESTINGKTIINVDIQPEYQSYISFNLNEWVEFINQSAKNNRIIFLYNGYDTLGMISESEYINWLLDLGIYEYVINEITFFDKGYAFFRYCMDNSIDEDAIVDLIKYMVNNDINDSRDIDEEMWNDFMNTTDHSRQDVRDLLEDAADLINIPELMEFLQNKNNITLTGGGINECLKEVELALMALDKPYSIISKFTY